MNHFTITFKPDGRQISIHSGATLIEAAGQAGIILNTVCGGRGTCKKCRVMLEPDCREVLACQYRVAGDLTVTIPPNVTAVVHVPSARPKGGRAPESGCERVPSEEPGHASFVATSGAHRFESSL